MIGVKGWYSANCRTPGPIVSAGTIALLKNGSMISGTAARPGRFRGLRRQPQGDGEPAGREAEQHDDADRAEPVERSSPPGGIPAANATPMRAAMATRLVSTLATT